jgi:hypothetical protein
MLEDRHAPVYYFVRDEIRMDLLSRTTHCHFCEAVSWESASTRNMATVIPSMSFRLPPQCDPAILSVPSGLIISLDSTGVVARW